MSKYRIPSAKKHTEGGIEVTLDLALSNLIINDFYLNPDSDCRSLLTIGLGLSIGSNQVKIFVDDRSRQYLHRIEDLCCDQ